MTTTRSCRDTQAALFARLKGELTTLAAERLDHHLSGCHECQAAYAALVGPLEAARAETWLPTPAQRDRVLDKVLAELPSHVPAVAERPSWRRPWVWLAFAGAAATVGVAVGLLGIGQERMVGPEPSAVATEALEPAPGPAVPMTLQLTSAEPFLGLRVAADASGRYRFHADEDRLRLQVSAGTVLVQLHRPPGGRTLDVTGPGLMAHVVGTVFYVHVPARGTAELGVSEGKVLVTHTDGSEALVTVGLRRRADGRVVPLDAETASTLAAWRAPEAAAANAAPVTAPQVAREASSSVHAAPKEEPARIQLPVETAHAARVRSVHVAPRPPAPTPDPPTAAPAPEDLYSEAEADLAAGHPAAAAARLEALLGRGDGPHTTAHLELARLYADVLGRPADSVRHLRALLAADVEPVTAAMAHALLCDVRRRMGALPDAECPAPP